MALSAFNQAAALTLDAFDYNRGNFQYDRKQRQSMEYELADMRIAQASLWRKDVRDFCQLTPKKMETYLLIIALELGFCVMALCKARVPPGAPPWLVACHTLAVIGALMYLFLALWFGMHAFVSSQAYKVRILTQLVRLPVPTWRSLEAARTYSSAFEKLPKGQMLRVPFATVQEEEARRRGGQEQPASGQGAEDKTPADPWGLERRGDKIMELAPNVNTTEVERQRHIWLAREAAKYYQTYDAFCRISMSTGTSNLALFFCYHCMTYVMAENAAPVSAFAGMIVFLSCACYLIRNDLMLTGLEYWTKFFMVMASPTISFVVAYQTGHHQGHPGAYAHLIVISLFLHGFSLVHSLMLFRVREMQTGAVLPTAFRKVLYIDPFGWAKHSGTWWSQHAHLVNTRRGSLLTRLRSVSNLSLGSFSDAGGDDDTPTQPTMQCVNSAAPKRPEDVEADPTLASRASCANLGGQPQDTEGNVMNVSFRPGTFSRTDVDAGRDPTARSGFKKGDIATGTDIHGEKPGLVPWRVYFVVTIALALCWWTAAAISVYRVVHGHALFGTYKKPNYGTLNPGQVLPIPELLGTKVDTTWATPMLHPEGLACDPDGRVFATIGRSAGGRRGLLHGEIGGSPKDGAPPSLHFAEAPACSEVEANFGRIQDVALMGCTSRSNCTAAILTKRGEHLVSCHLGGGAPVSLLEGQGPSWPQDWRAGPLAMPLGRAWLRDRGGEPLEDEPEAEEGLLQPEELASLSTAPCAPGQSFHAANECVAVGTTGRRIAQLGLASLGGKGAAWVPRRLLDSDRAEVPQSGMLALFGQHYLAALFPKTSKISLMDLRSGGSLAGTWRLPTPKGGGQWASICAGREAVFAMEDAEHPTLWRFTPTHRSED